ncbi:MAG: hypothetical protein U1B80_02165 [Anaerolineaceae bacterium]|nr:hypothetical protein [Anaerolineaceae bacterium]
MKLKRMAIPLLVMVTLVIGACAPLSSLQGALLAANTGEVLFWDDFSNPDSGWDTWNTSGSWAAYQGGGLRIVVLEPNFDFWSRPGKRYADIRLDVKATKFGGPDDNRFGILCRYQNTANYYAFFITSDGYAGIVKVKDGAAQVISNGGMQYREEIQKGAAVNRISVDCIDASLALRVNDYRLLEAEDFDFTSGEIGLIAGSYNNPGVDIYFQDFLATKP